MCIFNLQTNSRYLKSAAFAAIIYKAITQCICLPSMVMASYLITHFYIFSFKADAEKVACIKGFSTFLPPSMWH